MDTAMIDTLPTSEAIRLLGVSVSTFYRLMKRYNIVSESRGGKNTESRWDAAKINAIAGARRDIQTLEQISAEWSVAPEELELAALKNRVSELEAALEPFAHEDLSKMYMGMHSGNDSIVYGRDKAVLKLGDFRRARQLLKG